MARKVKFFFTNLGKNLLQKVENYASTLYRQTREKKILKSLSKGVEIYIEKT